VRKRRLARIVALVAAGLIVCVLIFVAAAYLWFYGRAGSAHVETPGGVGTTLANPIGTPSGMDILVLGCDKRPKEEGVESRSDTIMLVHADPEEDFLSVLSLPRDLKVEIPGHGTQKLNAAYTYGGWELAAETVERLTNVDITEFVEVDFQAFRDVVDALGGVYVDVDRRYYNDNPEYELIKLAPGYQLLDGANALDYVRFRHDLNYDFGRMRRQQRFLAAVREQAMGWNLVLDLPGIVDGLFSNLATSLSANDMLKLAYWAVRLDGSHIRQVSVIGDIRTIEGVSYVIPPEGAVEEAVVKMMTPPHLETSEASGTSGSLASGTLGPRTSEASLNEIDTSEFVTNPDALPNSRLWKLYAQAAPFVVRAPGYLPEGYAYVDRNPVDPGTYDIPVGDKAEKAIKVVYRLTRNGEPTDQYMGIMETTWLDAPAASKGKEVTYAGTKYTIVGTSQAVDHVWWIQDNVLYWVSNTLSYYLSSVELLKVAVSMIPVGR